MKQTKIVATLGPASQDKDVLRQMLLAGMNVARLNFSHGDHAWHQGLVDTVRSLSDELKRPIAILADLQGPRIRTEVPSEYPLKKGDVLRVSDIGLRDTLPATDERTVFLDLPGAIKGMAVGHKILIEDGLIELTVTETKESFVLAEAANDGLLKNRKGVILPDSHLELSILSDKDKSDLRFVIEAGIDYVGLSFVGSVADIESVREEMRQMAKDGARFPQLISKIERKEALKNLAGIIKASDGVMVARGDLGIEMPESEIAILQKRIIAESLASAKPVIVATQMMKSMTDNPRPTRAEVSDVSNAVIDHADAVMLSEESAAGKYPVETVAMMSEIIEKTEESPFDDLYKALDLNFHNDYAIIVRSVYELAKSYQAKAVMLLSLSGHTARLLSHFRPESRLLVATNSRDTWNALSLVWGVDPYLFEGEEEHLERLIDKLLVVAKEEGKLQSGDKTVVLHGRTPDQETLKLVGIRQVR